MQVKYKNRTMEKICTDASEAEKKHGRDMAAKIQQRIDQIRAASTVEEMIQFRIGRCHHLQGHVKINSL